MKYVMKVDTDDVGDLAERLLLDEFWILLLLLGNFNAHILSSNEACDALVTLAWVDLMYRSVGHEFENLEIWENLRSQRSGKCQPRTSL